MKFIDLVTQADRINSDALPRIEKIIREARFINGKEVEEFENSAAHYLGYERCTGVSSGTDALLITMMALGTNENTRVFLPAFTYTASAEAVCLLGAQPIFIDVDPISFLLCPKSLKSALTEHSRPGDLVMPVDLFGYACDYDEILEISDEFGCGVFIDGAQSFGCSYKGKRSIKGVRAFCTSFFPAKPLGCFGDGGAIFSDDPEFTTKVRSIRNHGMGIDKYDIKRIGVNGRLDTIQAAILSCKLDILDDELAKKRVILERYSKGLNRCVPQTLEYASESACAQAVFKLPSGVKNHDLQLALGDVDIPTMIYYPKTVADQTAYQQNSRLGSKIDVSLALTNQTIAFPFHAYLSEMELNEVIEKTNEAIEKLTPSA